MEGTVTDRAKAEALENDEMLAQLRAARPDLIGSVRMWLGGGAFVEAAYFTSEEAAREGETSAEFEGAAAGLRRPVRRDDLHGPPRPDPHVRRSMMVTLAWPPPSHIVCRP